ncbi:hypothetical protein PWP93_34520 [Paraburkholderia sp. A1RI-2L]|uniref:hypothetical protein n=1 Tax=Paraburkholderia sp. A1RI-2L TaxID=3028367 RepID=UPI003B7633EC
MSLHGVFPAAWLQDLLQNLPQQSLQTTLRPHAAFYGAAQHPLIAMPATMPLLTSNIAGFQQP